MTPREFANACTGYFNKRRDGWEQARLIANTVYNKPVFGFKIKPMGVDKFMELPWDNKEEKRDFTEEIEKIKEYRKWLAEQ